MIRIVNLAETPTVVLRLVLFLGLVAHKLVWEIHKRRGVQHGDERQNAAKNSINGIKLLKILVLAAILVQTLFLVVFPISENPATLVVAGCFVYSLGLATAITGRLNLGRNWADLEDYTIHKDQDLVTHGVYRYIRHPIYAGDVLLLLGLELALNSWLVLGIPFLFFIVLKQSSAEEAILREAFPGYVDYCKRSKRFVPFLF